MKRKKVHHALYVDDGRGKPRKAKDDTENRFLDDVIRNFEVEHRFCWELLVQNERKYKLMMKDSLLPVRSAGKALLKLSKGIRANIEDGRSYTVDLIIMMQAHSEVLEALKQPTFNYATNTLKSLKAKGLIGNIKRAAQRDAVKTRCSELANRYLCHT